MDFFADHLNTIAPSYEMCLNFSSENNPTKNVTDGKIPNGENHSFD